MFSSNYKMPSKEQLENKKKITLSENKLKDKKDCEMMYNLINQTLYNAISSKENKEIYDTDFKRDLFHFYKNIDIENCDGYNDYIKNLEERDIKIYYAYKECYSNMRIRYNVIKKELTIN